MPPRASDAEKPGWIANLAWGILRRIVPAADPHLESLYDRVKIWHLEVDVATGEALREVGLDSEGRVIVIGPWCSNRGFIVDCNATFRPASYEQLSAEQVEEEWNRFDATELD